MPSRIVTGIETAPVKDDLKFLVTQTVPETNSAGTVTEFEDIHRVTLDAVKAAIENAGIKANAVKDGCIDENSLSETLVNKLNETTSPHVTIAYRNEELTEPNTIYLIIDEDKPEPINAVMYDNVTFSPDEPVPAVENWFQTEGGSDNVDNDDTEIVMQNGKLTVLKKPDADTTFLND